MVTREALRQRLWPVDTFVDFDAGLNSAIKKLRDALGDPAEKLTIRRDAAASRLSLHRVAAATDRSAAGDAGAGDATTKRRAVF